jgi:predicted DNA-binding antitoxin AbrB/MazE fold protein
VYYDYHQFSLQEVNPTMSRVIEAIYENGVLRPLETLAVKEHQRVEIKILSLDDWQHRFIQLIERIQKSTAQYPSQEIESDISEAVQEVRNRKHDH